MKGDIKSKTKPMRMCQLENFLKERNIANISTRVNIDGAQFDLSFTDWVIDDNSFYLTNSERTSYLDIHNVDFADTIYFDEPDIKECKEWVKMIIHTKKTKKENEATFELVGNGGCES